MNAPDDQPATPPESRFLLAAGTILYGVMMLVALLWLWLRDRMEALPPAAVGTHGPWLASAIGLGVGWLGACALAIVNPRVARMRELEAVAKRSFQASGEMAAILFVTVGAIAEELFFRLAAQDAFGVTGSVAVAVLVNSYLAGWRWIPVSLLHALALSLIVQQGFGLLGSTTASAVMNYLNLRRIQCS